MKYCRHHPDRETFEKYRLCKECVRQRQRDKYKLKKKNQITSIWDEVNLKNLLDDADRMDIKQLASRYDLSDKAIYKLLKKHGKTAKPILGTVRNQKSHKERILTGFSMNFHFDIANIYPKYL